jgi:hypothetical protein
MNCRSKKQRSNQQSIMRSCRHSADHKQSCRFEEFARLFRERLRFRSGVTIARASSWT